MAQKPAKPKKNTYDEISRRKGVVFCEFLRIVEDRAFAKSSGAIHASIVLNQKSEKLGETLVARTVKQLVSEGWLKKFNNNKIYLGIPHRKVLADSACMRAFLSAYAERNQENNTFDVEKWNRELTSKLMEARDVPDENAAKKLIEGYLVEFFDVEFLMQKHKNGDPICQIDRPIYKRHDFYISVGKTLGLNRSFKQRKRKLHENG